MGPQNLLGYVNILSSRQLYPQHGRCHSLSKIREKRKGSKPDTRMAEGVPTAPDRNSGWAVTIWGLQASVRFYSMKRKENIFSHPFSTYLGVPQKNNKVRQKQYPDCTATQAKQNGSVQQFSSVYRESVTAARITDFGEDTTERESGLGHFLSPGSQLREDILLKLSC